MTKREPVETMSRMALMQELTEWRRKGPALLAVATAAEAMRRWVDAEYGEEGATAADKRLFRALDRLARVSGGRATRKRTRRGHDDAR